jgi:hypothetical protein
MLLARLLLSGTQSIELRTVVKANVCSISTTALATIGKTHASQMALAKYYLLL